MTYTEFMNEPRINWRARLSDETLTGPQLYAMACEGGWRNCPAANQDLRIPRTHVGRPEDDELATLGYNFTGALMRGKRLEALELIDKIDARAAELVAVIDNPPS